MRSDTKAFVTILFFCVEYSGGIDQARRRRLGDIILLRWGFMENEVKEMISGISFTTIGNFFRATQQIPKEAHLKLFTLAMDILSAGGPIAHKDSVLIDILRDQFQINQVDFDATMKFCSNRQNALGIEWIRTNDHLH